MAAQTLVDATRYVLAHFDGSEADCENCAFLHDEQPCAEHAVLNDLRAAFVREIGLARGGNTG